MLDSNPKHFVGYWPYLKFCKFTAQSIEGLSQSVKLDNFRVLFSATCTFLNLDLYQLEQCLKHFKDSKILQ